MEDIRFNYGIEVIHKCDGESTSKNFQVGFTKPLVKPKPRKRIPVRKPIRRIPLPSFNSPGAIALSDSSRSTYGAMKPT